MKKNNKKSNIVYSELSVFRLRIIHFGTIGESYGMGLKELIDWPYSQFMMPEKMKAEEGFLILSYLIKKIEQDLREPECSHMAVTVLNNNLDKFHFKVIRLPECSHTVVGELNNKFHFEVMDDAIIDLFTATGNMRRFKRSKYYNQYFEWFTDDVTFDEVKSIYEKYGYTFEEPYFTI